MTTPDALLARLDLPSKIRLLTGADFWSTVAEPAVGLRRMVLSDGPAGVRGESFDERDPSLSLPSPTALGATWDTALARRYGATLGAEARRQGVHVLLGPTVNLHRTPFGGRHFEAFAEDPVLTAELAVSYVDGVQAHGVAATPKHYVGNDAETDRFTVDDRIDERTLHERYLVPFEAVAAHAWAVMSAYNAVNGTTMSEHPLLTEPLTGEWGFDGLVMSDWGGVRSTEPSASAAQHLVMPGPSPHWGDRLVAAVRAGRIPEAAVDDKVRRLLRLAAHVGALDGASSVDGPVPEDGTALAREVAATGTVLARNDGELPWDPRALSSVAVLGQHAALPRTQGGGSATVRPVEIVSPVDDLQAVLGDGVVRYRTGAVVAEGVQPFPAGTTTNPVTGGPGVRAVFRDAAGVELRAEDRLACSLIWLGPEVPAGTDHVELHARWDATAGTHRVGAAGVGALSLTADGVLVLDVGTSLPPGSGPGAEIFDPPSGTAVLETDGGPVDLVLRLRPRVSASLPAVAVTLGERTVVDDPGAEIAAAAALAADSDVALVVVGTDVESEGADRTSLALPGHQDALVRAVAAANPRTVVLVDAGAPVLLPWRDDVAAVLIGWFGGERFGDAVADVLLGAREPGGRLPTTWPATGTESAVRTGVPRDGVLRYDEGLHAGYAGWLRSGETPAYPFGHGLGYTSWTVDDLAVSGTDVTVTLTNTGDRAGRQVVQLYLSRPSSTVDRPERWLAGWAVVDAGPGTTTARIPVGERAFRHRDGGRWVVEPGTYTVHAGFSVADTPLTAAIAPG